MYCTVKYPSQRGPKTDCVPQVMNSNNAVLPPHPTHILSLFCLHLHFFLIMSCNYSIQQLRSIFLPGDQRTACQEWQELRQNYLHNPAVRRTHDQEQSGLHGLEKEGIGIAVDNKVQRGFNHSEVQLHYIKVHVHTENQLLWNLV